MKAMECQRCGKEVSTLRIGNALAAPVKCRSCGAKHVFPYYWAYGTAAALIILWMSLSLAFSVEDYFSQGRQRTTKVVYLATFFLVWQLLAFAYGMLVKKYAKFGLKDGANHR